ncbi:MAG TPA: histidine--tRNA ligase [Candidatus Saccharimonadales bacterium]|nr:histidine--tRNA ligase [Candidatus Saccharimonadales bacterium]
MANLSNQPYKGTRDYYPSDKRLQNYIFGVWQRVAERFGYEEYAAPILEPLELYAAKTGQEIVNEQTYQFVDRGGRNVAIRPEMTPSIARMVAARSQELGYPARLYSIANFMRYERPQKGREREFWQLNLDLFGVDGVEADAEIIIVSDQIMREFGAKDDMYTIRINNRRLINFMMADYLELDGADALAMIKLFDRKDKMNGEQFMAQAAGIFDGQNSEEGLKKIQRLVSANSMADLPEDIRDSEAVEEVRELFSRLREAGVTNAKFDITLMRGFDYYTGMVFEVFDNSPDNNRAMFGGGRYDGLVGLFGGDNVPTVGVAPGATTTEEFLRSHQLLPDLKSTTDAVVIVIGDNLKSAQKLAASLRESGVKVAVDLTSRKTDKQIKSVVKMNVPYMIFVGDHEVAESKYRLKDVADQSESSLGLDELVQAIKRA